MNIQSSNRSGVLAGGNWIVDHTKILDSWPPQDALANILSESWGNGGSPYNILKDLNKLGATFPLQGIGRVGDDANGLRILRDVQSNNIDSTQLRRTADATTSYSDVMTDTLTGRRTFFHHRGANSRLSPEDFDFSGTSAKLFHLGYLLLLDSLDAIEAGRPRVCQVFERAIAAGLSTSMDCVSENSDRFDAVVRPSLPGVDVLFANDFEAEKLTGIKLRDGQSGRLCREATEEAASRLINFGVRQWVVLHFPEAAFAKSTRGPSCWQPSVALPSPSIKGTAGAGDAFAAGVLYGAHEGWPMEQALRLGVCTGASCLLDAGCSESIPPAGAALGIGAKFGWRELPAQG